MDGQGAVVEAEKDTGHRSGMECLVEKDTTGTGKLLCQECWAFPVEVALVLMDGRMEGVAAQASVV